MTYRGRVEHGRIVIDEPTDLPEGSQVQVDVRLQPADGPEFEPLTLRERLSRVIGRAQNLPPDMSVNHDHYLYDPEPPPTTTDGTFHERFKPFIGQATDLPTDVAVNHDHYLHGVPKQGLRSCLDRHLTKSSK